MSTKVQIKLDYLASLKPMTFMEDSSVKQNFTYLYRQIRNDDQDEAESFYEKESNYLKRRIYDTTALQEATIFSLYGCFMDVIINGLSFDPAANLVYLEVRNINLAPKGQQAMWEKRSRLIISPYGELAIRIECGQLRYIDQPVIVYECDTIRIRTNDQGNKVIVYEGVIPRTSNKIIASFVKLTRSDGSFDFHYLLEDDINRLKKYSEKQNSKWENGQRVNGKANDLYGSADGGIDPGFLVAKTIKHAFKTFPKIKIKGTNSELDDINEAPLTGVTQVEEHNTSAKQAALQQPQVNYSSGFDDDFGVPPITQVQSNGVTIDDDNF